MSELPRLGDLVRGGPKPGLSMARVIMMSVKCHNDLMTASQAARASWPDRPEISETLKSAVNVGSLGGSTWGSQVAAARTLVAEFVEATRAASVVSRLANVHRVPAHIRIARETAAAAVNWIGEASATAATEASYDSIALEPAKIAGLIVISEELAKSSSPSAEELVRRSLVNSIAEFVDRQFLDPANAPTAAHPGSITSQVTPITASGTSASAIAADITSLIDAIIVGGNSSLVSPVLFMSPRTAVRIATKRDTSGGSAFPGLKFSGGELLGVPVMTTVSAPYSVSGGGGIVLIDQNEILLNDDGEVMLDTSREAAVQMSSTPAAGAQQLTSLFQLNLVGIKAERWITWATRHGAAAACAFLDATQY